MTEIILPPELGRIAEAREFEPELVPGIKGRKPKPNGSAGGEDQPVVTLKCAADIEPQPIRWAWRDYLAKGKLHIIAGAPGAGKTTVGISFAATMSAGGKWPDGSRCEATNVIIWSGEDNPADTLVPRLIAAGADLKRVFIVDEVIDRGKKRLFDPAKDMDSLKRAIHAFGGAGFIMIDPIVSAIGRGSNSHKNVETRRALQPLVDLATQVGAALFGVTHFTKGTAGEIQLNVSPDRSHLARSHALCSSPPKKRMGTASSLAPSLISAWKAAASPTRSPQCP